MSMTQVLLDDHNADLNFNIRTDGFAGHSLSHNGWQFMWAGIRATHGVLRGRVFYEVHIINQYKLNDYLEDCDVRADCNVRVGWSQDQTNLLIGEAGNSFAYDAAGFKGSDGRFDVYGGRSHLHDILTCYLDLDSGIVSFQRNDEFLGTAFKLDKRSKDTALFPHICVKNTEVFVNFGQKPPTFKPPHGFMFISHMYPNNLAAIPKPPYKPQDCEVVMMIGLPGVGKTTYARKLCSDHPEKRYYLLGQDMIMDHLRNASVKRFKLKWNRVVRLCSDIAAEQLKLAGTKLRNYIVDQTNVYAGPRRDKLRIFEGFKASAVVLVLDDVELIKRCKKRELVAPKHIPLPAVDEMKKNFTLPHEDEGLFSEIKYVEQSRSMAEVTMSGYKTSRELNNKPGILRPGFRDSNMYNQFPRAFIQQPHRYPSSATTSARRNDKPRYPNHRSGQDFDDISSSVENMRVKDDKGGESDEGKEKKMEEKPEQIVHPIQSKPEQVVHPIQSTQYIKEPVHLTQDAFSHIYMGPAAGMEKDSVGRQPGIIPMSKINDHAAMFSNQLTTSHPGYLNSLNSPAAAAAARYTAAAHTAPPPATPGPPHHRTALPMSSLPISSLQFPRSQTPVSNSYHSSLGMWANGGSLSAGSFNQNTLSTSFGSSQPPFISQAHMSSQEQQVLAFQLLQQNMPFQQMMMPQNYQMGVEMMPQAMAHNTSAMAPSNTQILQQTSIPDQFSLTASQPLRYPAPSAYSLQKPRQFPKPGLH